MSAGLLGFIIGFMLGGIFGMVMLSVLIVCREEDERARREELYEAYQKRNNDGDSAHDPDPAAGNGDNNLVC